MTHQAGKTKWGDKDARRADLLRAGRQRLELDGYAAFSIRAVAQDAGLSPGSVYTYFANKEELFATLYGERLQMLQEQVQPLCREAESLEKLLVGFIHLYLPVYRVFGRELNLWSIVRNGNPNFPPELMADLACAATRLMGTIFLAVQRLAEADGVDIGRLENSQLLMPLLYTFVSGLADHFSSDRQLLTATSIDELAGFGARTLIAGLRQLAPASTTNAEEKPQ